MSRFHSLPVFILCFFIFAHCTTEYEPELTGFSENQIQSQREIEQSLLTKHTPERYRHHLYNLTQTPAFAGQEENREVIEYIHSTMQNAGLTVENYDYDVLLPQPGTVSVKIVTPDQVELPNKEYEYEEDPYTSHSNLVHGWAAYSGSGTISAEIVYANYGTKEDFERLTNLGVSVEGKIVLARFGGNFRGYKAKYAEEAGAAGLIMYTDPPSDRDNVYPNGIQPDESAIQRGSLLTLDYYGDPLTPFEPALPLEHPDSPERLEIDDVDFHSIPVAPIGYGAAEEILSRMQGDPAPDDWQGNFDFPYPVTGGSDLTVELHVDQPYEMKRISNVIGTIEGSEYPDEWIILGAHLDAWSFGATDPNSGTAMLLTLAESIMELVEEGYQPKRSILIGHWDAEEFMLIGSSEWVEHLEDELMAKSVLYLNADMSVTGPNFRASSSPSLKKPIIEAAKSVTHPDTGFSMYDYWAGNSSDSSPVIGNLGGGSDHVGFYMYAGIPSAGVSISGSVPIYHTNFDTFWFYENHLDPDFSYGPALADVYGLIALRFASAQILPYDIPSYSTDLNTHLESIRDRAGSDIFDGSGLMEITGQITQDIETYENRLGQYLDRGQIENAEAINRELIQLERAFLNDEGLPFSPWLRSLYASSDPYSGYASWMFPAYRYAIEEGLLDDEEFMEELHNAHLQALTRFSDTLQRVIQNME
ncbi:glutamate carboxypeptidase [Rhodohalobacter sp. SW132]|uniref:M28 family peptidase n=1 Tax=Rhodohalobacter sp. SW132 TaxID=2293433 RepID=UPI000E288522|nr:M28 family peptidase [Rhodohalobacter sp. SW132]REL33083.1 glutamate carboxypeptidase [Rhodohalobacter sp. SW132]